MAPKRRSRRDGSLHGERLRHLAWPLIDSLDGTTIFTYTDSLHNEDEDFAMPCEMPDRTDR